MTCRVINYRLLNTLLCSLVPQRRDQTHYAACLTGNHSTGKTPFNRLFPNHHGDSIEMSGSVASNFLFGKRPEGFPATCASLSQPFGTVITGYFLLRTRIEAPATTFSPGNRALIPSKRSKRFRSNVQTCHAPSSRPGDMCAAKKWTFQTAFLWIFHSAIDGDQEGEPDGSSSAEGGCSSEIENVSIR